MMRAYYLPALLALLTTLGACGQQKELAPDLAFNFRCHGAHFPASEIAIENFLRAHGFTVFNEERVRRQYHLWLYRLAIDGYDARHRMADFRGLNETPSQPAQEATTLYTLGIYSPPPTRHDAALEAATVEFVGKTLKCDVSQIYHAANGPERAAFYKDVYDTEQRRIAQGRGCDKQSGRPLDTHCPS
ncbi:MAG TPA: hypothetical protein VIJ85_07235 [Rhizomicrobium sp.]